MFGIRRLLSRLRTKMPPPSSKPPSSKQLPLGLSREDLEHLQALTETIHYKPYLAALEALYENNVSALLRGIPHEAYMFQCGVCFAIEQIAALPVDLTLKLRELDARHSAKSPDASESASAVFANTPFWDAYQRLGKRSPQFGGAGVPLPGERVRPRVPPGENGG